MIVKNNIDKIIKDCIENLKAGKRIQLEYNKKEGVIKLFIVKTKRYNIYGLEGSDTE